jgi:hypothetical protein
VLATFTKAARLRLADAQMAHHDYGTARRLAFTPNARARRVTVVTIDGVTH